MPVFTSQRSTAKYLNWVKQEFSPLTLATPDNALEQILENVIRYWNTHSAHKVSQIVDYTSGESRKQLNAAFKTVVQVLPTRLTIFNWNTHPLFTLTGVALLDNVTTDLIVQSASFNDLRVYVGADFQWTFEPSDDPTEGGFIYCINVPAEALSINVIGTRRILPTEIIENEHINEWVLRYFRALVKIQEGHTLRTASIIDIKSKGDELLREGKEEKKELQEELEQNSRWVVFAKRA